MTPFKIRLRISGAFRRFFVYCRKRYTVILSGFALTAAVLFLQYVGPDHAAIYQRINGLIYDLRLNATLESRQTAHNIIVLDIDERSLEKEGRFPWSRAKIAKIIEKLADAGAVVVAFDVMFAEPERNPVSGVIQMLQQQNLPHSQALVDQLSPMVESADADAIMARSLQLTDVVLGMAFYDDPLVKVGEMPPSAITFDTDDISHLHSLTFSGHTNNIKILQDNSPGIGFITSTPDQDSFIRSTSLIAQYNGQFYPSLALEAAKLYALADEIQVTTVQLDVSRSITGIKIGRKVIPTDEFGRVLIPFKGGQKSYPYISVTDLLHDNIIPDFFDSAIVFVGSSATGEADLRATPVGVQYPGVEVHANVIDGLLNPEYIPSKPDWSEAAVLVLLVILGISLSLTMPVMGPLTIGITGVLIIIGLIGFDVYLWSVQKISLEMATLLLLAMLMTIMNIAIGFFTESGKRKQIKGIFDQYVPPAHIDQMLEDPDSLNLSGQRKEMTVLFSDIRGFTTISEKLTAQELATLLNRYFSPITKSIFEHQGTIDKYVGDMVMAFWNAPLNDEFHVQNSINCAFQMLDITEELTAQFEQEGWPEVRVGVGINTGEMSVGDMGSVYRRAYTVLGDAVNLGSRLEGLTKFYGVDLLVSETCVAHCPDMTFRLIDKVRVKGKHEAVSIYEPIRPEVASEADIVALLDQYHHAHQTYVSQDWSAAEKEFTTLLSNDPNRKVYSIYLERISILQHETLAEDWDGSFTHTSK
ncbi:MAG: adenylate cyclase [Phenylobacterium sp.]|jgi:adenylate cyclase